MANRGHDKRGRSNKDARHIRLYHFLLETEAWRALSCTERALYLELLHCYNGTNNGKIFCSVRRVEQQLHISKSTAARAFLRLEQLGFIRCEKIGSFACKNRRASEWRLTDQRSDIDGSSPTREFMHWHDVAGSFPAD